jgi:predicted  nucleic acid-binding Zn-ribbon protein
MGISLDDTRLTSQGLRSLAREIDNDTSETKFGKHRPSGDVDLFDEAVITPRIIALADGSNPDLRDRLIALRRIIIEEEGTGLGMRRGSSAAGTFADIVDLESASVKGVVHFPNEVYDVTDLPRAREMSVGGLEHAFGVLARDILENDTEVKAAEAAGSTEIFKLGTMFRENGRMDYKLEMQLDSQRGSLTGELVRATAEVANLEKKRNEAQVKYDALPDEVGNGCAREKNPEKIAARKAIDAANAALTGAKSTLANKQREYDAVVAEITVTRAKLSANLEDIEAQQTRLVDALAAQPGETRERKHLLLWVQRLAHVARQ